MERILRVSFGVKFFFKQRAHGAEGGMSAAYQKKGASPPVKAGIVLPGYIFITPLAKSK